MKHYVFFTYNVNLVGGTQWWVEEKARYLEQHGWKVTVFFPSRRNRKSIIPYLNKFRKGGTLLLEILPWECPKFFHRYMLNWMKKTMEFCDGDEVIIESQESMMAPWAEMLAKEVEGKHCVFLVNEHFHRPRQYYDCNIDFYLFKYAREELFGIQGRISRLFSKIDGMSIKNGYEFLLNENPVRDVHNKNIESFVDFNKKFDWNICHVGRASKFYVTSFLRDFSTFVSNHADKNIHLILVGNTKEISNEIELLRKYSNLVITTVGDLVPIPRVLFAVGVDVFVASSGSAKCIADEGALVIVGDAESDKTRGLLGYETTDSLYGTEHAHYMTFDIALERVLVQQINSGMVNKNRPTISVRDACEQNMRLIHNSNFSKEYFVPTQKKRNLWWKIICKFFVMQYSTVLYKFGYVH